MKLNADIPLIQEEHPVTHTPYYCFHICHLQDIMNLICQHSDVNNVDNAISNKKAIMYLLNLLVYMSKYLGIMLVKPELYAFCLNKFKIESNCTNESIN